MKNTFEGINFDDAVTAETFMLEYKKAKMTDIFNAESAIDSKEPVYMMTWAPDPKELPDAPFSDQHYHNAETLILYCKQCKTAAFCVESTQLGNPHYHGWYQLEPSTELFRIGLVKAMQSLGLVKIDKIKHRFKVASYEPHQNALYYYKKDLISSMELIDCNPIVKTTPIPPPLELFFFVTKGRKSIDQLLTSRDKQLSARDFYLKNTKI